jgi:hypothetical protein
LRSSSLTSRRFDRRIKLSVGQLLPFIKKSIPVIVLIPIILLLNSFFLVKKIDCSLNSQPCPDDLTKVVNRLVGTSSLFVNQRDLVNSLKAIYPIDNANISFKMFNTLKVNLIGTRPFITVDAFLVKDLPILSMDQAPSTTDSASWWTRPTTELRDYVSRQQGLGFDLWNNGSMTAVATSGANISYIFSEKPSADMVISVYKLVSLISKYIDVSNIYIVNDRCFLSRMGEPDIIVNVPFDEVSLKQALQSLTYLATIKKDAKVIDLSFKNPIIR